MKTRRTAAPVVPSDLNAVRQITNVVLDHLLRPRLREECDGVIAIAIAIRRADDAEIPLRVQPDKNVGNCLRPTKRAHSDFLETCAIAGRFGAQSDCFGVLACIPSRILECFGGIERVAFGSRLAVHAFGFGEDFSSLSILRMNLGMR